MRQMSIAGVLFGMAFAGTIVYVSYRYKQSHPKKRRPRRSN